MGIVVILKLTAGSSESTLSPAEADQNVENFMLALEYPPRAAELAPQTARSNCAMLSTGTSVNTLALMMANNGLNSDMIHDLLAAMAEYTCPQHSKAITTWVAG